MLSPYQFVYLYLAGFVVDMKRISLDGFRWVATDYVIAEFACSSKTVCCQHTEFHIYIENVCGVACTLRSPTVASLLVLNVEFEAWMLMPSIRTVSIG
jgi:hypothetical protein